MFAIQDNMHSYNKVQNIYTVYVYIYVGHNSRRTIKIHFELLGKGKAILVTGHEAPEG
jgi:hypothetical protein